MEQKSRKTLKRVIIALSCLVIVAAVFCGGWFAGLYWGNSQFRSYQWALGLIEQYYYGDFDSSASENSVYALAAMLDDYSAYYSAEEYEALLADNSGSKSGIGVTYEYVTDDSYGDTGCLIVSVVGNSPAYHAGLRAGEVLAYGTSGATSGSTSGSTAGATTEFKSTTDFSSFVSSQPEGEDFTLTATDGTVYTVARAEYQASYTWMQTQDKTWTFETQDGTSDLYLTCDETQGMDFLPEGFAYIRLQQFYGTADGEMDLLIGEFNGSGCTSLILDLRSNGGGSVAVMEGIAGCFVQSGSGAETVAMTAVYKDGSSKTYPVGTGNANTLNDGTEIYILANSGTASASEALMGVLLSYGLTDYSHIYLSDFSGSYLDFVSSSKNRRTYGKGIMQSTYVNAFTGEALKLTVAKIYWPNGNCIHDTGITAADGCNTVQTPWVATKGDQELQDAVRMISTN